ncbi:MAG: adhesin, partial [Actinomycetota bacterium]
MTTHKNTPEQQYHHAPLNGLAIGTIVGAVWALVFLLWGVRGNFFMSVQGNYLMSVVFPVVGWMLGTVRADIL